MDDVKDSWELEDLPEKENEWPALQKNAIEAIHRIELHIKKPRPHSEQRILDFGSGLGFFLALAKEHGQSAYGLEPLPVSAVFSRAKFGMNITTDTLRENTFPSDFFDVITSFQVFEHLPYPRENLQHLHKRLRQDGIVFIEVPKIETWTVRLMKAKHRHFVQDHINFFTGESLCQLLANCGFSVLDQFHPTRHMSIRHITIRWFRQYLPEVMVKALEISLQRTGLWERTIGINIGDIITIIARKL